MLKRIGHHLKIMLSERYRQQDMQQADLIFIEGMLQLAEAGAGAICAMEAGQQLFDTFNAASRRYDTTGALQNLIDDGLKFLPRIHQQIAGDTTDLPTSSITYATATSMLPHSTRPRTKAGVLNTMATLAEITPQLAMPVMHETLAAFGLPSRPLCGFATQNFVICAPVPAAPAPTVITAHGNEAFITHPHTHGTVSELCDICQIPARDADAIQNVLPLATAWIKARKDMPSAFDLTSFPRTAQNQTERAYRELAASVHAPMRCAV